MFIRIRYFLLIITLLNVFSVGAQPPGALQAVDAMHRQQMQTIHQESMQRTQQLSTLNNSQRSGAKRAPGTGRYQYEVHLTNGEVIVREGRIEKYDVGDVFIIGNNHNFEIIKPDSTVRISRVYGDEKLVGLPYGNNWVFRVVTGAIQGYSPYPDRSLSHVAYMQIERGGVIESVDIDYLRGRMAGHEEALALLEMEKVGEAMRRYNRDIGDEADDD